MTLQNFTRTDTKRKTMESEKKLLNVGDKIAKRNYSSWSDILIIDRVTPKFAFSNTLKFKREIADNGYIYKGWRESYSSSSYYIVSTEVLEEIKAKRKRNKVAAFNFSTLSDDQINRIYEILSEVK